MDSRESFPNSVASDRCDGAKLSPKPRSLSLPHVLLTPELFSAEGGIGRISRLYLRAMAESHPGQNLTVIALNDGEIPKDALYRYQASHAHDVPCSRSKWRCWKAIWRATAQEGTHVVCTHVHLAPLLWLARLFGHSHTFDVVVHGIEVWSKLPWLMRKALASARWVISVSNFTRQCLVNRYPNLRTNSIVLPNSLDPSFTIKDMTKLTVEGTILAVSRLAPHDHQKGIDHLIEAMADVVAKFPFAQLRIVGEGADRARLQRIASDSPAKDQIVFLGFIPEDALSREFHTCHVFSLPSCKEGFGLVYLEAMASGKPCVVASAGGAPEVIDSLSGIITPYADVPKLAQSLIEALTKEWSPQPILRRARSFSFPEFAKRWQTLA